MDVCIPGRTWYDNIGSGEVRTTEDLIGKYQGQHYRHHQDRGAFGIELDMAKRQNVEWVPLG